VPARFYAAPSVVLLRGNLRNATGDAAEVFALLERDQLVRLLSASGESLGLASARETEASNQHASSQPRYQRNLGYRDVSKADSTLTKSANAPNISVTDTLNETKYAP
jgi:hypothetical protein